MMAPTIHPEDELLFAPEAGKLLGVSAPTVRSWVYRDRLPGRRIGEKHVIVRRADVDAYNAAQSKAAEG